jgi:hypothetical protein
MDQIPMAWKENNIESIIFDYMNDDKEIVSSVFIVMLQKTIKLILNDEKGIPEKFARWFFPLMERLNYILQIMYLSNIKQKKLYFQLWTGEKKIISRMGRETWKKKYKIPN